MFTPAGDIKDMTIPWLFQDLRAAMKTGTVVFARDSTLKRVYFKDGDILFASSNLEAERLGDYLLQTGKLTRSQFDASTELIKKTGKKQGTILVELGFISSQDLVDGVKTQVKQIILSLFMWRDGRYIFDDSPLPLADIIPLYMSTGNLIIEGVRELDWQVVRKSLPPLKTVLRPTADPTLLFQCVDLSSDQSLVLSFIDGGRSMQDLCTQSGIGDFNTLKAIYVLLSLRMVEAGTIKTEKEKQFVHETVCGTVVAPRQQQHEAPADSLSVSATRQMIMTALAETTAQDYYRVLGINRNSTDDEIRKAYFKLAKLYHPDRHFLPELADLKQTLETLFTRVHAAYETLNTQAGRNQYNESISPAAVARKKKEQEHAPDEKSRAAEQFTNGMKAYKVKDFWAAVEAFRWACQLAPENGEYVFYKGLALSHIPRRGHEAEQDLKTAIELSPTNAMYYLELGNLYLNMGMKSRAHEVFTNGLQKAPASEKLMDALKTVEALQKEK